MGAVGEIFGPTLGDIMTGALERVQSQSPVVAAVSLAMLLYSVSSGFRQIWREASPPAGEVGAARLRKAVLGRALDYLIGFGLVFAAPPVVMAGLLIFTLGLFARKLLVDVPLVGEALGSLVPPLMLLGS